MLDLYKRLKDDYASLAGEREAAQTDKTALYDKLGSQAATLYVACGLCEMHEHTRIAMNVCGMT